MIIQISTVNVYIVDIIFLFIKLIQFQSIRELV